MKIPFSVSVYEHAARLIGLSPWEVSRDGALVLRAQREAYRLYHHFPVVVGIDIYNLEAEACGCTVDKPGGNGIPAITRPLFASLKNACRIEPFDRRRAGRIPAVIRAGKRLAQRFPGADIRIPLSGPFSIAASLLGLNELLAGVAAAPQEVRLFLSRLIPGQVEFCRVVKQSGLAVAFFESAAAQ